MSAIAAAAPPVRPRTSGFRRLLSTELRLYAREPMLLFWGLVFPSACSWSSASPEAASPNIRWATSS